jgi:hypothetical protein
MDVVVSIKHVASFLIGLGNWEFIFISPELLLFKKMIIQIYETCTVLAIGQFFTKYKVLFFRVNIMENQCLLLAGWY